YINKMLSIDDNRPDFAIDVQKVKLAPYGNDLELEFPVYNFGNSSSENANLKLYLGTDNYSQGLAAIDSIITISGNDSLKIHHSFTDLDELRDKMIYLDIQPTASNDRNTSNNFNSIQFTLNAAYVQQNIGITFDKVTSDTLYLDEWGSISVDGNLITQNGFINYKICDISGLQQNLTTIHPVLFNNASANLGVEITPLQFKPDSLTKITFIYDQEFFEDNEFSEDDTRGYFWNSQISQWVGVESIVDTFNNKAVVSAFHSGLYTIMHSNDTKPPVIEFTVDGRPLETKSLVSSKPNISIFIEDDNGIRVERSYVQVLLNGNEVPANAIFIPDSLNNPGYLGIKVYPQLDPGDHVLTVRVQDVNHNISEKT
ncbi:MAG: hypothetical protein KAR38_05775, partial [Calditrichia bacterium]|nr:hypothetical protein [Calditrichia bacterium]